LIQLTPWISDLYGEGRTLIQKISWCIDPGVAFGAKPTCAGNQTKVTESPAAVSSTATFASPEWTGALAAETINLAAPSNLPTLIAYYSSLSTKQKFNGFSLLIEYSIETAAGDEVVKTFKRLLVSSPEKTSKNQNPTGLSILKDNVDMVSLPDDDEKLKATWNSSSNESYQQYQVDGKQATIKEKTIATWFITGSKKNNCNRDTSDDGTDENSDECNSKDGYFQFNRTSRLEKNKYTAPKTGPSSRKIVIVAVLRDRRGGIQVRPYYCDGPGEACAATP
jgi:hypothetical protein